MPERSTPKARQTRERILDAALRLFRQRGYDETTMRDVAAEAGLATGAAYYHFRSKEEIVMAYYMRTTEEMREALPPRLRATRDLRKRLGLVFHAKLDQLAEQRAFIAALFRSAVDPASPLSPFGDETKDIRDEAIGWMREAVDGSGADVPKDLAPYLPRLLWAAQMGLILFWLHDRTPRQARTRALTDKSLDLIVRALRMTSLPFMGPLRRPAVELLALAYGEAA